MNSGDVFVYDCQRAGLFVWCGNSSTHPKQLKGMAVAKALQSQAHAMQGGYSAQVQITKVVEPKGKRQKVQGMSVSAKKFWRKMQASSGDVAAIEEGGSDDMFEAFVDVTSAMYEVDQGELVQMEKVDGVYQVSMMRPDKVYLFQAAPFQYFAYYGKKSKHFVKQYGRQQLEELIKGEAWAAAAIIEQGHETVNFKERFVSDALLKKLHSRRSKMNVYTARQVQMRLPGGSPVWIPKEGGGSSLDISVTDSAPPTPAKALDLGDATELEDVAEVAEEEEEEEGRKEVPQPGDNLAAAASNEAERHVAMRMKELKLLSQMGGSASGEQQQLDDANAAAAAAAAAEQEAEEDAALAQAEAEDEADAAAARAKAKAKADIERLAEERSRTRAVAMLAESEAAAAKSHADAEIAALKRQLADAANSTAAAETKAKREHEALVASEAQAAREHEARAAAEAQAAREHADAQREHELAQREHAEAAAAHKEAAVAEAEALAMAFMSASGNLSSDVASHLTATVNVAAVAATKRAELKEKKERDDAKAAEAAAAKSAQVKSEAAQKRADAKAKKEAKAAAEKKAADETAAAAAAAAADADA